jgi:thymidine phosphorylase
MSKKLALGASALILDVKAGNGAFCKDLETARALAKSLISAADGSGTAVEAMITDMNEPLGHACGNANEVIEAFDVLSGAGPADLVDLARAQCARILVMSGRFDEHSALNALDEARASGRALERANLWLEAQGADPDSVLRNQLPKPNETVEVQADRSGFIAQIDAYGVGMLAIEIGCGRRKQDDVLDHAAGILLDRKTGEEIRAGETIARLQLGTRPIDRDDLRSRLALLISISDTPPAPRPLIYETLKGRSES